jgi:hypothetical protein
VENSGEIDLEVLVFASTTSSLSLCKFYWILFMQIFLWVKMQWTSTLGWLKDWQCSPNKADGSKRSINMNQHVFNFNSSCHIILWVSHAGL